MKIFANVYNENKVGFRLLILTIFCVSITSCGVSNLFDDKSSIKPTNSFPPSAAKVIKQNSLAHFSNKEIEQRVESLIHLLTLDEKISLVHASGKFHVNAIERLNIPEMWLSDGPHGVRHQIQRHSWESAGWKDDYATYLPHLTSVAASWDLNIAALHGDVLGSEARHRQKDFILGPGVNLARLPLYGRNFEYMGEDPILAAKLVVPQINAIQNHDVAATIKHYALNTQELNRTGVDARPDERTLREVYLPAFEYAVKEANVWGVMGAYNEYYGTNANQSKHLNMDILKGEWGFNGVLLTDWNVDINTVDAANNGLDLEMGTDVDSYDDYFFATPLKTLIQDGKISQTVLDDKVRRILRVQHVLGMHSPKNRKSGERNTKTHQLAAKKIATEGAVLLKNNNVLPFDISIMKNILVIGPNADKKHGTGGGSSEVKSLYEVTPLMGIKNKINASNPKVNVKLLRAKSTELMPIPSDYIVSRHWTGTPAWQVSHYKTKARSELLAESWVVDSAFTPENKLVNLNDTSFITMNARVQPLTNGHHVIKVNLSGSLKLKVNNKEVLTSDINNEVKLFLKSNTEYKFEIQYEGNEGFKLGWEAPGKLFASKDVYLAEAKKADAVIFVGGLSHADDRESIDRTHMQLPNSQDEIIDNLLSVNPNTVVLLVAGSAVEMPWVKEANAILWGWYGGMEAGNAFADILFGDANPSGKMPITLPKKLQDTAPIALNDYNETESLYKEGVFIGYRWFEQQKIEPLFPFGHGLSYTQFEYSNLALSSNVMTGDDQLIVSLKVKNIGKRLGKETVQLYLNDIEASVDRPRKELKNFHKVTLAPNESKTISMTITKRDLQFWDVNNNDWLAEEGLFTVLIGASIGDIKLQSTFAYKL